VETKSSFAPAYDASCRVLILGSLPGERSLAAGEYYANPANQFWRLVGNVIERDLVPLPYTARLSALIAAGVGLWDVIRSARRTGSLDTAIRDLDANGLAAFASDLPNLRCIAFNGGTASAIGRKHIGPAARWDLVTLPSSSPAYCAITVAQKQSLWLTLRQFLTPDFGVKPS
jgi:TDG/mug DNA glycosylase family protein